MSVTLRSMIIAAVLIISAVLLYNFSNISGQISSDEISERYPNFIAKNLSGEIFDADGNIKYAIFGEKITYFKKQDLVKIQKPVGFYYDEKTSNQKFGGWQVSADQATIVLSSSATLTGNIFIVPNFAKAEIKEISTPSLYFDMIQKTLSSPDEIRIAGKNVINQGKNYVVDLKARTFVIKENPHAVYYPYPVDLSSNRN